MTIRAIAFDLDGTLCHTLPDLVAAANASRQSKNSRIRKAKRGAANERAYKGVLSATKACSAATSFCATCASAAAPESTASPGGARPMRSASLSRSTFSSSNAAKCDRLNDCIRKR